MSSKRTEPGSFGASSSPVSLVEVPEFNWRQGLTDSEREQLARWNSLDFGEYPHVSEDTLASVEALAEQANERLAAVARGGSVAQVSQLLVPFADMLGCQVPGEEGLDLMTAALGDIPVLLYERMALRVAQSHRYNRLPYPADFRKTVAGELAYLDQQRTGLRSLVGHIARIRTQRTTKERILHQ